MHKKRSSNGTLELLSKIAEFKNNFNKNIIKQKGKKVNEFI
jgi:hypothetical protein